MTDNIINMPTPMNVLADRIRNAFEKSKASRAAWVEATLSLAVTLGEARDRCGGDDTKFGIWLAENQLDFDGLGHQTRAALINMASNLPLARVKLEETERSSWQHIWAEEMKDAFTHASKGVVGRSQIVETPETIPQTPQLAAATSEKDATQGAPPETIKMRRRNAMYGLPRADEVYAVYREKNTRSLISSAARGRGGKEVWSLVLAALDQGFLTPTDMALRREVTARILFPTAPAAWGRKYDLGDRKTVAHVRDVIMPAAIANKEAILAAPDKIAEILARHEQQNRKAQVVQRQVAAVSALPNHQQEIVVFGERLWPAPPSAMYDYDQLRAAVWYFRDINTWLESSIVGKTVGSRANTIRHTTKWPWEYASRNLSHDRAKMQKVYSLIDELTRLMERRPDGECKWPPTPTSEGQW